MNSRKRTLATTVFAAALSLLTFANFGHAQSMDSKTCDCHKQTDTMSNQPSRAYINAYNVPSTGIALEGYSPVSYFTEGKAQKGSPSQTPSPSSRRGAGERQHSKFMRRPLVKPPPLEPLAGELTFWPGN